MKRAATWALSILAMGAGLVFGQDAALGDSGAPAASPLLELFHRGGPMMWPVLLSGVIGLLCGLERLWALRRSSHTPLDFHKDVVHVVDVRGVDAGLALCIENCSSLGRVLYATLLRYGSGRADMESAVNEKCRLLLPELRRNTDLIGLFALLCVPLGLLGLCLQLVIAFDNAGRDVIDWGFILQGSSNGLLVFSFGLAMAMLLACLYFVLRGRAHALIREINENGIEAVVTLDRKARQSIRLIEDLEEQIETKDMPGVKAPDLAGEFDEGRQSGVKTSITTRASPASQETSRTPKAP